MAVKMNNLEEKEEAAWPSGPRVRLAIRQPRVRVPHWLLAGFVLGDRKFVFSAESPWKQEFLPRFTDCPFYCGVHKCQQDKGWLQQEMLGGERGSLRRKYECPWVKTSKPVNSCVEEEAMSLSVFYCCIICNYVCLCRIYVYVWYLTTSTVLCRCFKVMSLVGVFPYCPFRKRVVQSSVLQQTLELIRAVKYHDATVITVSTLIS